MQKKELGEKLVEAVKDPSALSGESFVKAMELTKAYANSGSVTQYTSVTRLFYDLFEMFETGEDPRNKK